MFCLSDGAGFSTILDSMSQEIYGITERNQTETRIPFGPEPHQHLPVDKAGELLVMLRSRISPKVFGDCLLLVMLGTDARGRPSSNGHGPGSEH